MKKWLLFGFFASLLILAAQPAEATVIESRHVFYNYSDWDDENSDINTADDSAIAPDKSALLPGQTSTLANFTSYQRGINGIMIDISGLAGSPSVSDFGFLVGNSADVSTWATAPAPADFAIRTGGGVGGSDRVSIVWDHNAIDNQWLQITARPTLGLDTPDVFYFGNLIGDVTGDGRVSPMDELIIIAAINDNGFYSTTIDDPIDLNRDGWVDAADALLVNQILNSLENTTLASFTAPETGAPVPEPTTILLLGIGLVGLAGVSRKKFIK